MSEQTKEKPEPEKIMWWGYLHQNGSIQLKRWFGDVKDYTTDCEGNEFVVKIVKPFESCDRIMAMRHVLLFITPPPDLNEFEAKLENALDWLMNEAEHGNAFPGNEPARVLFLYTMFHREKFGEMLNIIKLQDFMLKTNMEKDLG